MTSHSQPELLGLDIQELAALVQGLGEPEYRARQLYEALYRQRAASLESVSTLPEKLRRSLSGHSLGLPRIERQYSSSDGTIRYLIAFADGQSVETVWMPEGDGGEAGDGSSAGDEEETKSGKNWRRATICVSSQVGCAVDCKFCLTATLGLQRNLSAGEIVGQVLAVLNDRGARIAEDRINLVFMGQGEPFLNYENFTKAVRLLVEGARIPASRMTVSTSGIVPRIHDLGQEAVRPKLAISLNASNDDVRARVMPINRKWPIAMLLEAARSFPLRNRERITFEYVLLDGVNDEVAHARELAELLRGLRAKVNLIALNPGPGIDFGTPADARVRAFQQVLIRAGIPTFIRRPRGRDIFAACGQLKRTVAEEPLVQLQP
ncbi:MAG: 23S rRNA (adenine(2503)-C(2))-methyltransferase RlmN [Candidatus Koribacter versatilis]|uniref:Probable dual-specificity RNA methyltransferase RlmN n=1 Tax=Candidatus Korobacter versatilis TaxID=658062 RepID=A0A932EQ15_9BACT|nr:23S rRNA (adenine(2503)-C(2))-methyltransferase RlmN [Candidatus Koribacter versatilis]